MIRLGQTIVHVVPGNGGHLRRGFFYMEFKGCYVRGALSSSFHDDFVKLCVSFDSGKIKLSRIFCMERKLLSLDGNGGVDITDDPPKRNGVLSWFL